jgi:hypothetical protein
MRSFLTLCAVTVLFLLGAFKTPASILSGGEEKLIFAPEKIQKGVSWSDKFSLKETGLETKQLPTNQSQDVWLQTHPFPIGLSWRPPIGANFNVYLEGSSDGRNPVSPVDPQIFIRYSSDKINWSTWYYLGKSAQKEKSGGYEGGIWLPSSASEKYRSLMRDWWKTDPVWSSDETEFCEWLLKKEPDFFAKEMPFIGYVQVRFEQLSVNPSLNLKSMTVRYMWGVGGLATIPKDKSKVRKNTEDKWFFEGNLK